MLYGTGEGQTANVATRIGDVLSERGHDATVVGAAEAPTDLAVDEYDAILVGASVHLGKHQSAVVEFVRSNRDVLARKPTAFFQVSLSSATAEGRAQAAGYVEAFLEDTGWHPDRVGLFGGALRYSKYGFLKRMLMNQTAKRTLSEMPEADDAGDVEFTDWHEVDAFAADVAAFAEGRLNASRPAASADGLDE